MFAGERERPVDGRLRLLPEQQRYCGHQHDILAAAHVYPYEQTVPILTLDSETLTLQPSEQKGLHLRYQVNGQRFIKVIQTLPTKNGLQSCIGAFLVTEDSSEYAWYWMNQPDMSYDGSLQVVSTLSRGVSLEDQIYLLNSTRTARISPAILSTLILETDHRAELDQQVGEFYGLQIIPCGQAEAGWHQAQLQQQHCSQRIESSGGKVRNFALWLAGWRIHPYL